MTLLSYIYFLLGPSSPLFQGSLGFLAKHAALGPVIEHKVTRLSQPTWEGILFLFDSW